MTDPDKLREAIEWAIGVASGRGAFGDAPAMLYILVDAAESTLPKTKMVEVWRVEYVVQNGSDHWLPTVASSLTRVDAEKNAADIRRAPRNRCIRVTGPHQQEVPA